jgi:hypothetical protein
LPVRVRTDAGAIVKVRKLPRTYRGKGRVSRYVRVLIYIPRELAEQVGISLDPEEDDYAVIVAADGRLIVRPVKLEELVGPSPSPQELPAATHEKKG